VYDRIELPPIKPDVTRVRLFGGCQCRLNFPQKRRLKIPHFVLDQSRP
jgi:hypothetical protein